MIASALPGRCPGKCPLQLPRRLEPLGGERIDHILVNPAADWAVTEYVVDDTVYGPNGRTPSDHRPVFPVAQLHWH